LERAAEADRIVRALAEWGKDGPGRTLELWDLVKAARKYVEGGK
jgi:hypothetical protein